MSEKKTRKIRTRQDQGGGDEPAGSWVESEWREILAAYKVPEPRAGFVDRVLEEKRFQDLIRERRVPDPSPGFVEDTLSKVLSDRERAPRDHHRPEVPLPRRRLWAVAAALAAILVLAFLLRKPGPTPLLPQGNPMEVAGQLIRPQNFSKFGSNPFSRALSSRTASILPPPPAFVDFEEK